MTGMLLSFEQEISNADAFTNRIADGKEFSDYVEFLDALCDVLGVRTISSFCNDVSEDEEFRWFDPDEGLQTASRLRKELTNQLASIKGKREREITEILIADMEGLESDSGSAIETRTRFALIYC